MDRDDSSGIVWKYLGMFCKVMSLRKRKQTKIQSASLLDAYKCFYSEDWVLKRKKITLSIAIRSVTSNMSSVVTLKIDCGVKGGAIPIAD